MTEPDDDWVAEAMGDLNTALTLKQVMLKRGLRRARCKCTRCGNETLQGALVGRRNHGRFWCTTEGCSFKQMME
jgi:hypothetical protein